jgi:hypothetical protein
MGWDGAWREFGKWSSSEFGEFAFVNMGEFIAYFLRAWPRRGMDRPRMSSMARTWRNQTLITKRRRKIPLVRLSLLLFVYWEGGVRE